MSQPNTPHSQSGFTLIEIGLIVPILIVFLLALFDSLYIMVQSSAIQRTEMNSAYDIQTALYSVEKDVMLSSQFLPTNDSTITDAYPPSSNGNKWSYRGESSLIRALILKTYASTTNPESNDRQPVFLDQAGCTVSTIFYNDVQDYNTIYFVRGENLYKRRILNTPSARCSDAYQRQSCPSLETLGTSTRSLSCQADDELIVSGVSKFDIAYYDKSNSSTPLDVYATDADPLLLQSANAIELRITLTRKAMGKSTSVTSSILIPRLNISRTGN